MINKSIALVLGIVFPMMAHAADVAETIKPVRPFRLGVYRMNPDLDGQKPLAYADSSGYVLMGDTLIGSYDKHFISAWNFKNHKRTWWIAIDGELTAPPLLVENTVFAVTHGGTLLAINASNGEKIWSASLEAHSERPLTIANGKLYVVTAGQVAYAFDAASGKRLWLFDAGFPDLLTVRKPPAGLVHDGRFIFGIANGELVAVNIADGKLLWRYNPLFVEARFHDTVGEMTITGGKLLMTRYDGFTGLVDLAGDRKTTWQEHLTSVSTSAFRSGRHYVGLVAGDVIAYDAASGRSIWRTQTGVTPSFIVTGETVTYAVGAAGRVTALDNTTGTILWADDLGGDIASPPIVGDDRMYISTGLRNIYGYKI